MIQQIYNSLSAVIICGTEMSNKLKAVKDRSKVTFSCGFILTDLAYP
jgi:hypothetical protein